MATTLPVPIEFTLPQGWHSAPPDELNAPGVAFLALHPSSADDFTANITVDGQFRPDAAPLTTIADESVVRLEQGATVALQDRTEVGSSEAPGLTQMLQLSTTLNDQHLHLIQSQVFLSIQDSEDSSKRAIIQLTLTTKPGQFDTVIEDFQQFVRTVRLSEQDTETGEPT